MEINDLSLNHLTEEWAILSMTRNEAHVKKVPAAF